MSEISKLVDQVARDALAGELKALGFRKAGRTWRRTRDGTIQVVHVQASRSNLGANGQVTLNVGVYFPALAARLALFPVTDAPAESDCHLRTRPLPPGQHWWTLRVPGVATPERGAGRVLGSILAWLDRRADRRARATNARAAKGLREAMERSGLPWLERMADLCVARDELARQGPVWWAATASLELGDPDEAAWFFKKALAKGGASDELRRWGRANGLEP